MKFFNYHERTLKRTFQEEIPIPAAVENRIEETLSSLKDRESASSQLKRPRPVLCRCRARWIAAVCCLFVMVFCFGNPAIASKLPLIGSLFVQPQEPSFCQVIPYLQQKNWGYGTSFYQNQLGADDYTVIHKPLTPDNPQAAQGVEIYLEEIYCNGLDFVVTYRIVDENHIFFSNAVAFTDRNGAYPMSVNGFSLDAVSAYGNSYAFSDSTFFLEKADDGTFVGCTCYNLAFSENAALRDSLKDAETFSFTLTISQLCNQEIKTGLTPDGEPYSYLTDGFTPSIYLENQWSYTYTGPVRTDSVRTYSLKEDSDSFSSAQLTLTPLSTWFSFEGDPSSPLPEGYVFSLSVCADQKEIASRSLFASGSDVSYTMYTTAIPQDAAELSIELSAVEKSSASEDQQTPDQFSVMEKKTVSLLSP